jgi:hypothetical protein
MVGSHQKKSRGRKNNGLPVSFPIWDLRRDSYPALEQGFEQETAGHQFWYMLHRG